MPRDADVYLADILEAIERIQDYVRGLNYEAFAEDGKTLDAVLHNLEIIGEAAKRVPDAWKERDPSLKTGVGWVFGQDGGHDESWHRVPAQPTRIDGATTARS